MMHENSSQQQRAILAAADLGEYDIEESLDELSELADTAGCTVVGRLTQRRDQPDKATFLGSGRLEELKEHIEALESDLVIFDHELSGSQLRNLEKILEVAVIDRTTLILDIFAQRAVTGEGKLQVALAQERYRLPRLIGQGQVLSRLGGGIGTRGPGETKLESDRRHIRKRIQSMEQELSELSERREQVRRRRKKDNVLVGAIVGYTNAGKSTLLNALTGSAVFAEDKLFATLDPTSRALELPDGRSLLLVDTVGFIRRLPHHLVQAFRSTLEEAVGADILLNVCDYTNPAVSEHLAVTDTLLRELGVTDTPVLTVYNKCDLADYSPMVGEGSVAISAKSGEGIPELLEKISKLLCDTQTRLLLLIPYSETGLINEILVEGKVFSTEYREDGTLIDALVDNKLVYKVKSYITLQLI